MYTNLRREKFLLLQIGLQLHVVDRNYYSVETATRKYPIKDEKVLLDFIKMFINCLLFSFHALSS